MSPTLELYAGGMSLGLLPDLGGSIAFWRNGAGMEFLRPVSDPHLVAQHGRAVAGYPLVPFSNRVAGDHFRFEGVDYHLAPSFAGEDCAIHGNGWQRRWRIALLSDSSATLALDHTPSSGASAGQWPFSYRAQLRYDLHEAGLSIGILLENTDTRDQPVGMGFHPYFPRHSGLKLGFTASSVWTNGPDHLPLLRIPADGDWSFARMRDVGPVPIDNCYAGWSGSAFLRWPRAGYALTLEGSPELSHLVLFTPPGQPYIGLEPVSNMNDGFNRTTIADSGVRVLAPGQVMEGHIRMTVARC
ncbi:aldose 1-epimerase [Komagataeibacter swingsii]|uniref:Aldose epimerase n=1 Tax=Komagataeibacter swingsii TaxID=215220 RepID=A0A2V4RDN6_9PROT|nr:aldose 1-epimerase [Komagataeibacter swingsii]PYD70200.1 aldose epimerase [Komagataeibacter swingsii]GBQ64987.1 aldose 1-epimerase [Komagataeibacter swingsii DSM 16373]